MRRVFSFDGRRRKSTIIHHCACVDRFGRREEGRQVKRARCYSQTSPERLADLRRRQPGKTAAWRQQAPTLPPSPHPETNMAVGRPETMPDWVPSERRQSDPRYKACHYRAGRTPLSWRHRSARATWVARITGSFVAGVASFDLQLYARVTSIGADLVSRCALTSLSATRIVSTTHKIRWHRGTAECAIEKM